MQLTRRLIVVPQPRLSGAVSLQEPVTSTELKVSLQIELISPKRDVP
jgi:hypothetical protein